MEFHLVCVQELALVLPDMETGVEFCFIREKDEIQDTDAYAFLKYIVRLPGLDLFGVHFGEVEQGAVSPHPQFGKLDLNVDFRVVVHGNSHIEDALFILLMYLLKVGV